MQHVLLSVSDDTLPRIKCLLNREIERLKRIATRPDSPALDIAADMEDALAQLYRPQPQSKAPVT